MYEKPELTVVGNAQEVVLGWAANGDDIDGSWMPGGQVFAEETIPDGE